MYSFFKKSLQLVKNAKHIPTTGTPGKVNFFILKYASFCYEMCCNVTKVISYEICYNISRIIGHESCNVVNVTLSPRMNLTFSGYIFDPLDCKVRCNAIYSGRSKALVSDRVDSKLDVYLFILLINLVRC